MIEKYYTIGGYEEFNSNISCDDYIKDYYDNNKTYEDCEESMIKKVVNHLVKPNNNYIVLGGNLTNQLANYYEAFKEFNLNILGLYGACSTFVESLIISKLINKDNILIIISSHSLVSERQFRFPIEYGSLKKSYGTNTITSAIGLTINNKGKYKMGYYTIGKVIDSGILDANNIGAIMAPSCANTISRHLYENKRYLDDYDYILTGDLGKLGLKLLKEILKNDYGIITNNIMDAGSIIYKESQKKDMGGSGPTVLPYVLLNKVFKTKFKRILIIGTGSLHNQTIVNQHHTLCAISHAIEIEALYD